MRRGRDLLAGAILAGVGILFALVLLEVGVRWMERFFGLLTDKRIRRGTFENVRQLESAIRDYVAHHNENSEPFTWTATADSILKKIARFCLRTSDSGH